MLISEIQAAVCAEFRISMRAMNSATRWRPVARPRQIAMYLARELTGKSFPQIGAAFGRDHTTVIEGCRRIEELRLKDMALDADVRALTDQLSRGAAQAHQALGLAIAGHEADKSRNPRRQGLAHSEGGHCG